MTKTFLVILFISGFYLTQAYAEESVGQKFKDAAHDTRDAVKGAWKNAKPKIKSAAKDIKEGGRQVGHAVADSAKKAATTGHLTSQFLN